MRRKNNMWKIINNQLLDLSKVIHIEKYGELCIRFTSATGNKYFDITLKSSEERHELFEQLCKILEAEKL